MASTTAMFTGLSGLSSNARRLDVIGNNIANVNTTAYKSTRLLFSPTFSRNLSMGSAPGEFSGGTNPGQIGLGTSVAGTQRNFASGSLSSTGITTDLAIEGDGFFVVDNAGEQVYTRNGAFQRNQNNDLITSSGARILGYGVDNEFQIIEGELEPINIPLGSLTLAEATRNVVFNGNLNASGVIATQGSEHATRAFYTDAGLTTPATAAFDLVGGAGNDLFIDDGAGGSFLALDGVAPGNLGPLITINGIEKGGKDLGEHTFQFTDLPTPAGVDASGTTLQDFVDWLEQVMGLDNTSISGQSLGGGITINGAGEIIITGNEGEIQDLDIETADIVVTNNGAGISQPFVMTKNQDANGESVRTSYVVYDSLGTPLTIDLTFVLQDAVDGEGTTWEWIAESSDNDALDRIVGLGVVEFDANGAFESATNESFSVTRTNGAVSPLTVTMDFNSGSNAISALSSTTSNLAAIFQDGSPIGTLSSFSIGNDGIITGAFSNGLTRNLGQIALARFTNSEGLVDLGNGEFKIAPNSGTPLITTPQDFGTGRLLNGALELSNVDLSQEFINMILASTGYSASSRVITTSDQLLDELLLIGR